MQSLQNKTTNIGRNFALLYQDEGRKHVDLASREDNLAQFKTLRNYNVLHSKTKTS